MIDDFLLKLKNRKLVVLLAPVLVGLLLGGLLVVRPFLTRVVAIRTEKSALSQKESVFNTMIEQEKKISNYRQRLSLIQDKAKFIEELNGLAGQSGLTILSMVPEERRLTAAYLEKIDVKIDAEGNFHQLGAFVSRIESLEQFVKIVQADINTESNVDSAENQESGGAVRARSSRGNVYKISIVVGLFYPAKDIF